MSQYPFTLDEIVSWFRSKQSALQGSVVSIAEIKQGDAGPKPGAGADFDGANTIGRISGWVSGEFDFEALRTSDGKDIYWRQVEVLSMDELEGAYADFLKIMQDPPSAT